MFRALSRGQIIMHCRFGQLLTLLYELPLIEKCWRELLSLVLICMHDNLFHLKEY